MRWQESDWAGRKHALSTSGIVPGIEKLAKERCGRRRDSLNADDEQRDGVIAINKKYPLKDCWRLARSSDQVGEYRR